MVQPGTGPLSRAPTRPQPGGSSNGSKRVTCYSTRMAPLEAQPFLQHHHGAFFHHCPALHRVLGGRERPRSADNADFPRCGRRLGTAPPVRPRMHDNHDSLAGVCAFGVGLALLTEHCPVRCRSFVDKRRVVRHIDRPGVCRRSVVAARCVVLLGAGWGCGCSVATATPRPCFGGHVANGRALAAGPNGEVCCLPSAPQCQVQVQAQTGTHYWDGKPESLPY